MHIVTTVATGTGFLHELDPPTAGRGVIPPARPPILVVCILQIKYFIFPHFLLRRVWSLIWLFLDLYFRKKTWIYAFIPLWKLRTNIAQTSVPLLSILPSTTWPLVQHPKLCLCSARCGSLLSSRGKYLPFPAPFRPNWFMLHPLLLFCLIRCLCCFSLF